MQAVKSKKIIMIEALRGFASVYIVIHHFLGFSSLKNAMPAIVHIPFKFGQEMVILFFLMSGFVIYTANQKIKNTGFFTYFKKRFIRIYPIFFLTLLLSFIILIINHQHMVKGDYTDLLGNIFMLQDTGNKPGAIVYPFLQNYPLWSLSYEWWFYMLFFPLLVYFQKLKLRSSLPNIYIIFIISVISWFFYILVPNHLLLILSHLIIWWAGVYIAQLYFSDTEISLKSLSPVYITLSIMTVLSFIPLVIFLQNNQGKLDPNNYPLIDIRHFASGLVIVLIGHLVYKYNKLNLDCLVNPLSKLAPISYAIYCVHFPFILLNISFISNPYLLFFIKLILIIAVSYLFEIVIQPIFYSFRKQGKPPVTAPVK